jgi:hypothetical protein
MVISTPSSGRNRFGAHVFRPGEYVSIRNEEGEMHTFQVVTVEHAA